MAGDTQIKRTFRVRFAQIDGARVIYYPRYLEMIADVFPEAAMDNYPFDLAIRFKRPNRLGDDIKMCLRQRANGWSVSDQTSGEYFSVTLTECLDGSDFEWDQEEFASFTADELTIRDWMCGPKGTLHLSRYFELISHTVEQWFESCLGITFSELHVAQDLGIPTVQMDTRCLRLPPCGARVRMGLRPLSVGASAVQLISRLTSAGNTWLETRQIIVFVELNDKKIKSTRIPEVLRKRMLSQLATVQAE